MIRIHWIWPLSPNLRREYQEATALPPQAREGLNTAPPGETVFGGMTIHRAKIGAPDLGSGSTDINRSTWIAHHGCQDLHTLCQQGEPPWWKSNLAKPAFTSIFIHVHLILSICIFSQHVISTKLLTENCVDVLHLVSQLSDALTTSRWLGTTLQSWAWAMPSLANEQLATVGALEK